MGHPLSISNMLKTIRKYADLDKCEGYCDEEKPYEQCPECRAREALNDISELLRQTVKEIVKANTVMDVKTIGGGGDEIIIEGA